jgi:hypothetical protein
MMPTYHRVAAPPAPRAPTDAELAELAEVAKRLREERRARSRHRFVACTVALAVFTALWMSRDQWLHLVTSDDPYQATPAANFPIGDEGIVMPAPTALPDVPVSTVADALLQVRRALHAAYLDDAMLVRHDPGPLLSLLAPDSAKVVRTTYERGGYGTTMVRLAPGTSLAGPPRVSGRTRFAQVDWRGTPAVDVTTNYVLVYALNTPDGVVVFHSATHRMFPQGRNLLPSSRGMYLGRTQGYWQGMDCTTSATGLTAAAPKHDRGANPNFTDDDPDAYFDPHRSVRVGAGCR